MQKMASPGLKAKLLLWSAFGGLAYADIFIDGLTSFGESIPYPSVDNETFTLIAAAQANPNLTRDIAIKPFNSVSSDSSEHGLADVEWHWRVNISDVATPNAQVDKISDAHIVSTSYDFSWPETQEIPAELNNTSSALCITIADAPVDMPVNVTNAYTEDDAGSASCVHALGQACVDAILASAGRPVTSEAGPMCSAPRESWAELDECRNTLEYASKSGGSERFFATSSFNVSYYGGSSNGSAGGLASGEGIFGTFSAAQNGSGSAEYYTAANRLQIMMINPILQSSGGFEYAAGAGLYCMRVNTTKLPGYDAESDDVTWTSEAVLDSLGTSIQAHAVGAVSLMVSIFCAMVMLA
ncbi:hypothetical protein G7054_g4776 [Neopestalotiopsis clavispora]|nr:hypothetical protein G7054_g4776 [Neopestalotiopsis clavispora]